MVKAPSLMLTALSTLIDTQVANAQAEDKNKIVYPQALPYIFVGLRNALSLSLIATVVVEMMMAGRVGLGYSIFNAYQVFRVPEMYAYIVVTGLLGWIANKMFLAFEHKRLHWVGW